MRDAKIFQVCEFFMFFYSENIEFSFFLDLWRYSSNSTFNRLSWNSFTCQINCSI